MQLCNKQRRKTGPLRAFSFTPSQLAAMYRDYQKIGCLLEAGTAPLCLRKTPVMRGLMNFMRYVRNFIRWDSKHETSSTFIQSGDSHCVSMYPLAQGSSPLYAVIEGIVLFMIALLIIPE